MKVKSLLAFGFILLPSLLMAELIDNERYTTDTVSGFDWLDMSETIGRSYQQVSLGAGGFLDEGWRIATAVELDDLFGRVAQTPEGDFYQTPRFYDALALINCLGATFYQNTEGQVPVLWDDDELPITTTIHGYFEDLTGGKVGVALITANFADPAYAGYTELVRWTTMDDFSDEWVRRMHHGVFLVRDSIEEKARGKKNKRKICGN